MTIIDRHIIRQFVCLKGVHELANKSSSVMGINFNLLKPKILKKLE